MQYKGNLFKQSTAGLNSVFFLLDWLPNRKLITQSALLFTYTWRGNWWINAFPKGISTKGKNSLAQDSNSSHLLHFLQQ